MKLSFSLPSKSQSNRSKKPSQSFSAADAGSSAADSSDKNYVTEFDSAEAPVDHQSKPKFIPPIPNQWRPNKKLKNLPNLPSLKSDGENTLQFEVVPDGNPDSSDKSMAFGLNLRSKPSAVNGEGLNLPISDLELRKLREDLEKLPEDAGIDEYTDMPVEGFGAALLSGYGWNKDRGIGRNAKEDTKILEVKKRAGRGGLGYEGELPDNQNGNNSNAGEAFGSRDVRRNKREDAKEKKGLDVGKEVRIVKGSEMGMKGKIIEVRSGGDLLVLRMSRSGEKVKVRVKDVVEVGSAEEEKCLRKLKELKVKDKNSSNDKSEKTSSSKRGREEGRIGSERLNWLRNHIRVRIVSEVLKVGRLYLKKGVVMDVVGPGICDISMDESGELVQGVDQDLLETAIPKCGGKVLVLYGRHKGVYGRLLERDLEKETGLVQDADTQEFVNVRLEQIAEYIGDPSHIVTDDRLEDWQQAGGAYNIGIFHWRPSDPSKKLAKEWKAMLLADDKIWDQNGCNELVRRYIGPPVDEDSGLVYAYDGNLMLGILPASIFCSGHTYFVQSMYQQLRLEPYATHTTFQYAGTEGKRHWLREAKVFYDPPKYYDAPGNVLLLKNSLNLSPNIAEVSQEKLLSLIAERLIDSNSNINDKDAGYAENQQQNIADAIDLLPRLTTGIDVNIKFTRIDDFEFTRECAIFGLLDIPLYHGWIVDPQDYETMDVIGSKSYNTLTGELVSLEAQTMKSEYKQNLVDDSVDFVAATTAALGVPSPSLSRGRSFDDSACSDSPHSRARKGDVEEVELLIALKLSKAAMPKSSADNVLNDEFNLILSFTESACNKKSELVVCPETVEEKVVDQTVNTLEHGTLKCVESNALSYRNNDAKFPETVIGEDTLTQSNCVLPTSEESKENCKNVVEKTGSEMDVENEHVQPVSSDQDLAIAVDSVDDSVVFISTRNEHVHNEVTSTSDADVSRNHHNSCETRDSSDLLTSPADLNPLSSQILKTDDPETFKSSIGSEPIYEGEECILVSGTTIYENREPVYEGEVILSGQVDKRSINDGDQTCKDKMTAKQGEWIRNFLRNSASQLTVYGLFCLQYKVKERELCVFFRNNHFNTMFKLKLKRQFIIKCGFACRIQIGFTKLGRMPGVAVKNLDLLNLVLLGCSIAV